MTSQNFSQANLSLPTKTSNLFLLTFHQIPFFFNLRSAVNTQNLTKTVFTMLKFHVFFAFNTESKKQHQRLTFVVAKGLQPFMLKHRHIHLSKLFSLHLFKIPVVPLEYFQVANFKQSHTFFLKGSLLLIFCTFSANYLFFSIVRTLFSDLCILIFLFLQNSSQTNLINFACYNEAFVVILTFE